MSVKWSVFTVDDGIASLSYQPSNHHFNRAHINTLIDVPIIAIDGEGYSSQDGDHHYDLIAAAGNDWTDYKYADHELKPDEIFEFLLGLADKYGKSLFFIYGGSYDFNMWVKRLPEKCLLALAKHNKTRWQHYKIKWVPKREIIIQDKLSLECKIVHRGKNKGKHTHYYKRRIHIYDVIGFFQMSFVKALEDWKTVDQSTIENIAKMKKLRGQFDHVDKTEILGYCLDECRLLVKLGNDFRAACNRADIRPYHWYGAGALAASLMRRNGIKLYLGESPEVKEYQLRAYFGGRTEVSYQGHIPNGAYQYDINSAYPTAMVDLPCLAHGKWEFHLDPSEAYNKYHYGMWHVKWNTHGKLWPPFPWRDHKGRIYYPDNGEGIYHKIEIEAALRLYPDCQFTIYEGWTFTPQCSHQPFSFIPERAAHRLKLKAEGKPENKPLKLGLNSLYGKTAQSVGEHPPYQNFFWAGLITATTRAKLLDAINWCSGTVYSVATDGILSSCEIDELEIGTALGTWEKAFISEGFIVRPGIYKLFDKKKGEWKYGTRGMTSDETKWNEIESLWDRGLFDSKWSTMATRFIGLIQSLGRGSNWHEYFGKWVEGKRELSFCPVLGTRIWDVDYQPLSRDFWQGIFANPIRFMRLKPHCHCEGNLISGLSNTYNKIQTEAIKDFIDFLIDEDQP